MAATTEDNVLVNPQESDMQTLTNSIVEWRRLKDDNDAHKQQVREANTKMKALEEIILRVMKAHNIGALDLKNSGGRVLFKTKKAPVSIGHKGMVKAIGDYFKSSEEATKLIEFIQAKREIAVKESIQYEKV